VRGTTIAVGALILCTIASNSAKAKTDRSTCEQRCHEYYCSGGAHREFYCRYECHKKCLPNDLSKITHHEK
jgi:hypothetical protein